MGKVKISIGDDTASGEPENGPLGPYITDTDDGTGRVTTVTTKNGAESGVRKPKGAPDAEDDAAEQ
jgi:hypothetical protein